jgi:hypothetical protein
MRAIGILASVMVAAAATALAAGATTSQAPSGGFGAPRCLVGDWVANRAESSRVVRALVPIETLEFDGKLYMQFRDGRFQYGTTGMVMSITGGDLRLTATGRFFSLHPYTAVTGALKLGSGERTTIWGRFTGTKNGKSYTVDGPPQKTQRAPGGAVPFQCRGSTLKVRLPRFASLNWITLRRA